MNITNNTSNIIQLFRNGKGEFQKNLKFQTLVLAVIVLVGLPWGFPKTYGFIILLIAMTIFVTNTYVGVQVDGLTDKNKITMSYLNKIQSRVNKIVTDTIVSRNKNRLRKRDINEIYNRYKLDNFYIDATMIHFIHSFLHLADKNPSEFILFTKGVNNILRIRREIEEYYQSNGSYPENTSELFEIAISLKTNTINNLHNMTYAVHKSNQMYKYVDSITDRYNVLISRNLDMLHTYYRSNIKQRGINTTTKFVSYNTTKPYEASSNHSVNPKYNKRERNNKLVQFYY